MRLHPRGSTRSSKLAVTLVCAPLLLCGCPGTAHVSGGGNDMAVPLGGDDMLGAVDLAGDMGSGCAPLSSVPTHIDDNISTDTTLTCDHLYLVGGTIMVDSGATLTIQKGTTMLMGAGASLVITPGSKLIAIGERDLPIVFTSSKIGDQRKPGDWGSVVLVGKAPGNWGNDGSGHAITSARADANDWPNPQDMGPKFPVPTGTPTDVADSSGTLKYVRLEYGGQPTSPYGATDHEMLALYGAGSGTTLDYIDMRQANFECLFAEGGAFLAKHLACQWSGNGGFGFSRGNVSKAQFLFDQESPYKEAEGIGIKGPFDGNTLDPRTDPLIYNVTVCGTNGSPQAYKDPWGLFMRRNAAGKVYNLIATGFRAGSAMTGGNGGVSTTELHNSIFYKNFDPSTNGVDTNIWDNTFVTNDANLDTWFNTPGWGNSQINPMLPNCFDTNTIRASPATAITNGAAQPPADGFFDPNANYIGAFKDQTDDWAKGSWITWSSK